MSGVEVTFVEQSWRPRQTGLSWSPLVIGWAALVVLFGLTAIVAAVAYWMKPFHQEPQIAWAKVEASNCRILLHALRQYKSERGVFPTTLDQLVPQYIAAVPTVQAPTNGNGGGSWHYRLLDRGGAFVLWVPVNHWVSSFDTLVFKSDGNYSAWATECSVVEFDGWLYAIGGSDVGGIVVEGH